MYNHERNKEQGGEKGVEDKGLLNRKGSVKPVNQRFRLKIEDSSRSEGGDGGGRGFMCRCVMSVFQLCPGPFRRQHLF